MDCSDTMNSGSKMIREPGEGGIAEPVPIESLITTSFSARYPSDRASRAVVSGIFLRTSHSFAYVELSVSKFKRFCRISLAAACVFIVASMPVGPAIEDRKQYEASPNQHALISIRFISTIYGTSGPKLDT